MTTLIHLLQSRLYWLAIALFGFALLAVALYYQYALGEEPCQVCIQSRIWVAAFTLVGVVMALCPQARVLRLLGHVGVLVAGAGLTERAWFLYQLENGIGNGSCEFYLGLPDWFALDRWVPWLFEVRNLCSFTPEMLFGLSMAEALMAVGVGLCLAVVFVLALDWMRSRAALT